MLTPITYSQNKQSQKYFNISLITVLILNIGLFSTFKKFEQKVKIRHLDLDDIIVLDIPVTKIEKPQIAPKPPSVPIPTETDFELNPEPNEPWPQFTDIYEAPPAPPPPTTNEWDFIAVDQQPMVIGGYESILKYVYYPELARKLGLEGKTIVHAIIDVHGNVVKTKIFKSMGHEACDVAALQAVQKTKWIPAKQRDKPVKVVVAIPIHFQLSK